MIEFRLVGRSGRKVERAQIQVQRRRLLMVHRRRRLMCCSRCGSGRRHRGWIQTERGGRRSGGSGHRTRRRSGRSQRNGGGRRDAETRVRVVAGRVMMVRMGGRVHRRRRWIMQRQTGGGRLKKGGGESGIRVDGGVRPSDRHTLAFVLHAAILEPDLRSKTKERLMVFLVIRMCGIELPGQFSHSQRLCGISMTKGK